MARANRIDPSIAEIRRKTAELAEAADARGDEFLRYLYEMPLNYLEQEASKCGPQPANETAASRVDGAKHLVDKLRAVDNPIV